MLIKYLKYCFHWYKYNGFVTKTKPSWWSTPYSKMSKSYYKFLGPIAFYLETKELEYWRNAAREYKSLVKANHGRADRQSAQFNAFFKKHYNLNKGNHL